MNISNIKLNPGGLIGALLGIGVLFAVLFGFLGAGENFPTGVAKLVAFVGLAGGVAGNFGWKFIFTGDKEKDATSDQ